MDSFVESLKEKDEQEVFAEMLDEERARRKSSLFGKHWLSFNSL